MSEQKLPQQPKMYEQRTRGMSKEEKQSLKDLVAMYKKAEDNIVDSVDAEGVQRPGRMSRKVDIDQLDFEAVFDDFGRVVVQEEKGEGNGFEWRHSRACANHYDGICDH